MSVLTGSCFVQGHLVLGSRNVRRRRCRRRVPAGPRSTWGHGGISGRSPEIKVSAEYNLHGGGETYTGHQLEHRCLSELEQMHNLLQALEHGLVITHGLGHTAGQAVAQSVVDVQFAGGSRGQERVVQA